jgi:hypothetical protein
VLLLLNLRWQECDDSSVLLRHAPDVCIACCYNRPVLL